ncbi:hypothetical protein SUDANB121_03853 [Nocardiopsis dassonvillei]|uniref:GNAT family N-acetyltransferase n=1 Tax=Nocardiopsis dassonvillei TaxID=2014 RepID=UPI003F57B66F
MVRPADDTGEVALPAAGPGHRRAGLGTVITRHAADRIRARGTSTAVAETGGDEGHAPARAAYEKAGPTPPPIVRRFRAL